LHTELPVNGPKNEKYSLCSFNYFMKFTVPIKNL
jgi:hypothetical protein